MTVQCPNCNEELFFECLNCGWVNPDYRDTSWMIRDDGTVIIE